MNVHSDGSAKAVVIFPAKPKVPNPFDPTAPPTAPQAVPDSVTRGADGTFCIGELTGFPSAPGTAAVCGWRPGRQPKVFTDGFTNIIDLAVTRNGEVLVLEIASNGLLNPIGAVGKLTKVSKDGTKTVIDTGVLNAPGGLAIDAADTDVHISDKSTLANGGEIVRVRL